MAVIPYVQLCITSPVDTLCLLCVHTAFDTVWDGRRLQGQVEAAAAKLEQQATAATKAVSEECERHGAAERALQQQVQQLTSELAVTQVRQQAPDPL